MDGAQLWAVLWIKPTMVEVLWIGEQACARAFISPVSPARSYIPNT